jgi:hypothetical protein
MTRAFILPLAFVAVACGVSETNLPTAGGTGDGGMPPRDPSLDAGTFIITSPKPAFQVKSSTQLFNSVRACFGNNMLLVTPGMLQTADGQTPNPSAILPSTFSASTAEGVNDIITVQKFAFDGDATLLRQGTRADSLTLQYVTAQRNMANVVATNCVSTQSPMCACATPDAASALLSRCLPQMDPNSPAFQAARAQLQVRCMTSPGQAIASFLASAAIAKLP